MKKKFFLYGYFLEGLILAQAATDFISPALFILLFVAILGVVYWKDGLQPTTLYYIPISIMFLIGRAA
jgi:hypothetical protein